MIDWSQLPRGKPVIGARKIAGYIFGDEDKESSAYALDRAEFGLQILAGKLVGHEGWLDSGLARRASAGGKRSRNRAPEAA